MKSINNKTDIQELFYYNILFTLFITERENQTFKNIFFLIS